MNNLRPVVLTGGAFANNNLLQQALVLKALQTTTDIDEIKRIAKLKSRSEVLKTLDKIGIRKDYHAALAKHALLPDDIVREMAVIISTTSNDRVKLGALQAVLKSLGLDKYEVAENSTSTWEDILLEINDREQKEIEAPKKDVDYKVVPPVIPEEYKHKKEDLDIQKGLYED